MGVYILDSNFFIEAYRATYPLDVAPSFWNKVRQLAQENKIISIDKVKNELYNKNDALEVWCTKNLPHDFFKDTATVMTAYSQVVEWAVSKASHYLPNALNEFLNADEADAFIVAFALSDQGNRIIVTQEISEPNSKKKIKIPEACFGVGVPFVNTIEMFRHLRETF